MDEGIKYKDISGVLKRLLTLRLAILQNGLFNRTLLVTEHSLSVSVRIVPPTEINYNY